MNRRVLILIFTFCFLTNCAAPPPNNPTTANVNTAPPATTAPSPAAPAGERRRQDSSGCRPLIAGLLGLAQKKECKQRGERSLAAPSKTPEKGGPADGFLAVCRLRGRKGPENRMKAGRADGERRARQDQGQAVGVKRIDLGLECGGMNEQQVGQAGGASPPRMVAPAARGLERGDTPSTPPRGGLPPGRSGAGWARSRSMAYRASGNPSARSPGPIRTSQPGKGSGELNATPSRPSGVTQ